MTIELHIYLSVYDIFLKLDMNISMQRIPHSEWNWLAFAQALVQATASEPHGNLTSENLSSHKLPPSLLHLAQCMRTPLLAIRM